MVPAPHRLAPPLCVRVAGSTSNLGPGFDLLGLALSLYLEVRLEGPLEGEGHTVVRTGVDAEELVGVTPDLLPAAFDRGARELGSVGSYRLVVHSEIPVGRGFGSSGAAVAAGLLLARALTPRAVEVDELLPWGIELEGHPDNVTASLFGGCTLCHPAPDGRPARISNPVHPSIGFTLAWPRAALTTQCARGTLPDPVSRADAVENPRRLAFLLEGLRTGDPRWLSIGTEDRLHVAHRLALVPGASRALAAARHAGAWTATMSGAGSGLVALGPRDRMAAIAEAMAEAFRVETGGGSARVVEPVAGTPAVHADG